MVLACIALNHFLNEYFNVMETHGAPNVLADGGAQLFLKYVFGQWKIAP